MTTEERRFAVFILTHGRANSVYTYEALRNHGYTGEIYLVCDDEDGQIKQYKSIYGIDSVIVFNKQDAIDSTDSGDNFKKRNSVVYARNQNFKIAAALGLTHFWQLDDDYISFRYAANNDDEYITDVYIKRLDELLFALCDFMDESGAYSVAMAQGGDFIGGGEGTFVKYIKQGKFSRKVMNSFLFRVDRPVKFMGRINEDVNMYVEWGRRGHLFVTVPRLRLEQNETQANSGGLTDIYLDLGTYVKSFYSVLYAPSCVTITEMGCNDKRIHHKISWRHAAPKIIDEQHRKPRPLVSCATTAKDM